MENICFCYVAVFHYTPVSHCSPVKPATQAQLNSAPSSTHDPPLLHGSDAHSSISKKKGICKNSSKNYCITFQSPWQNNCARTQTNENWYTNFSQWYSFAWFDHKKLLPFSYNAQSLQHSCLEITCLAASPFMTTHTVAEKNHLPPILLLPA